MKHQNHQQNNWNDYQKDKIEYGMIAAFTIVVCALVFLFTKLG